MFRASRSTTALAGALAALTGGYGLLLAETLVAKRRIGTTGDLPPQADGVYGVELPGEPVRLLIIGDSTAVGYGMERADETPPALAGIGLAHVLDRPIDVRSEAEVGARTSDLAAQVDRGIDHRPDLVIILVGANDVTHQVPPARAARRLARLAKRLRAEGAEVIVGTCPDLGTVRPMPQPLRQVARIYSRRLARAQLDHAVRAGARCVSLADLLEPIYILRRDELFGDDLFHPSADGYANAMGCLVAGAAASWRLRTSEEDPGFDLPRDYMPIDAAAAEAAEHGGTEVVPDGRWASVWRRPLG